MNDEKGRKAAVFQDMLIAAMLDAAIEGKNTQLRTTITPETTGKATIIRIIIIPDQMPMEFPGGLGA